MQDNDIDGSGGAASGSMTAPQTVADVLDAAATRLEQPGTWTQYTTARDENGAIVEYDDPRAVCFCALGAIFKAAPLSSPGSIGVDDFFGRYLGGYDWMEIGRFNDAPGRTQSEVVAALRAAATSARQGETK